MIVAVCVVVVVVFWAARRAKRRQTLAGLNSARPTFTVEPARRRHGSRNRECL